jgi:multidrug transporter EmrE-like cation transporter
MYKILIVLVIALNSTAQFLLKKGAVSLPVPDTLYGKLLAFIKNPIIISAVFVYGMAFVMYSVVLSKLNVGIAYPTVSVGAILTVLMISVFYFHESLTIANYLGVFFCIVGIILLLK